MKTFTIPITLAAKLAAIAVHVDEAHSPGGHDYDTQAAVSVARDPEVLEWLKTLGPIAPVKR